MEKRIKEMLDEVSESRTVTFYKLFRGTIKNDYCETAIGQVKNLQMSVTGPVNDNNNRGILGLKIKDGYNIASAIIEFLTLYRHSGAKLHSNTVRNIEECIGILVKELNNYEFHFQKDNKDDNLEKETFTLYFNSKKQEVWDVCEKDKEVFSILLSAAAESLKARHKLFECIAGKK